MRYLVAFLGLFLPLTAQAFEAPLSDDAWAAKSRPTYGQSEVFGKHTHGCIQGAQALPLSGTGYVVIRHQRNRYWGHPTLLAFVKKVGAAAYSQRLATLMVGDLGQPRGGPISGHGSHESGLDVDIWLKLLPPRIAADPNAFMKPKEISVVVDKRKDKISPDHWRPEQGTLIMIAAQQPEVDRIFVNPAIKKELCRTAGSDRTWLRKVRPWYNHTGHMHVRLRCPEGSPDCQQQSALPPGDGCGQSLAWWFTEGPYKPKPKTKTSSKPRKPKPLPKACHRIYQEKAKI